MAKLLNFSKSSTSVTENKKIEKSHEIEKIEHFRIAQTLIILLLEFSGVFK